MDKPYTPSWHLQKKKKKKSADILTPSVFLGCISEFVQKLVMEEGCIALSLSLSQKNPNMSCMGLEP